MRSFLKSFSIRNRLLIVYIGILLVGFGGLTLIAGEQISSSAREDYEQRLKSEILLIAQGTAAHIDDYLAGRISDTDLNAAFADYGNQVSGTLTLFMVPPAGGDGGDHEESREGSFRNQLELETALRGSVTLVERSSDAGEDTLYTAAPVLYDGRMQGLLQLSVPASNLQAIVVRRWLELGLMIALVALLGIVAALWLARSIIQPLYKLRESAQRLSQGNFSHRVAYDSSDEIGEVARAFNEMAAQVESMLEEQRAFASNTSHELRTPLTTIRLRTEALRYDATLEADVASRYIEEIDDEVIRLGNLIQDLTLLSRFDAGRAELGHDQVDMRRFATSLRDQMSHVAKDRDITIALTLPDEPLFVNASIHHLTVVFRNLLDNAIKYTPPGGTITWTMEKTDSGIRDVIRDTGRGIDPAHLPHLFERFYRADKAHTRDIPGTGLGLALVKSIVEAYHGQVSLESSGVDQGTTATVLLPRQVMVDTKV